MPPRSSKNSISSTKKLKITTNTNALNKNLNKTQLGNKLYLSSSTGGSPTACENFTS